MNIKFLIINIKTKNCYLSKKKWSSGQGNHNKDHGREEPTFLVTNNFDFPIETCVELYAGRWRIENKITELVKFFSLNALSSPDCYHLFDLCHSWPLPQQARCRRGCASGGARRGGGWELGRGGRR